jgi:uncharacterized protein (TIGR02246 family)
MPATISADDRFAIYDVLGRYSRALDTADAEGYAALFMPDATLQIAAEEFHGRDAIREYIKRLTGVPNWAGYRHHNTQVLFEEGDGQRCRVSCYSMIMWRHRSGEVESRQQGIYRDIFVKGDDDLWYFAERRWEEWDPDKLESYRPSSR